MGNKSSSTGGQAPKVSKSVSGIIQEGRPPIHAASGSGSLPDLRDAGPVSLDPRSLDTNTNFGENFSMKARHSEKIGGRPAGGKSLFTNNPVHEEGYYDDINKPDLPRGFPNYASSGEVDLYWKSLDQVTSIWPEYDTIRSIDVRNLRPPVRQTLQQILKRLSEQHDLIRKISIEQHESRQELTELKEEHLAGQQRLRRKDQENKSLKEDVFILRADLKKDRARDTRLPRQGIHHEGHDVTDHSGRSDRSRPIMSESDVPDPDEHDPEYESRKIFKRRERDGIFKATPLLVAEGSRADSKRAVQRTHSLKPAPNYSAERRQYKDTSAGHPGVEHSDLRDKLWRVEIALEKERRENEALRERLNAKDTESVVSISSLKPKRKVSFDEYKDRYLRLEECMLTKIMQALSTHLSHTSTRRQQQFACAVIQKAYDVALDTVTQFKDVIKSLISNPINATSLSEAGSYRRNGALAGQISLFEHFKPGYGINQDVSKLAKKSQVVEDLPDFLTKQIYDYLDGMADLTNIVDLVETLVDALRQEYGDCTTAALLNKAEFSDFLHDCCRFAWQVTVISHPLCVSSDLGRYEERCHVAIDNNGRTNAKIDYYTLPILFSKKNGGEVLYKGRVSVKT